jgi:hypothetical protein
LLVGDAGLTVLEGLLGGGVEEADAVMVAHAGGLGDQDLDILDGGVGGHVDRGGQVLDGLLGCWSGRQAGQSEIACAWLLSG